MKLSWPSTFLSLIFLSVLIKPAHSVDLNIKQAIERARSFQTSRINGEIVESDFSLDLAHNTLMPRIEGRISAQKDVVTAPNQETQTAGSLALRQDLINVANWKSVEARKYDLNSSVCEVENNLITISADVIRLFYAALGLDDEEKIQKKQIKRLQRVVSLFRETTKLRLSGQNDLYSAEVETSQKELQIIQLAAEKTSIINQLKSILGLPPQEKVNLVPDASIREAVDFTDWPKWVDQLPSMVALKARVLARATDSSAASWEAFPTVDLSVTYSKPIAGYTLPTDSAAVVGTVTIPFFDQGIRRDRKSRAERLKLLGENQLIAKRNELYNNLLTLAVQREADQRAIDRAKKQVEISEKALNGAWTLLSLGKKDYLTIKISEDAASISEREMLAIRRRLDSTTATMLVYSQAAKRARSDSCR
jgi:outer membrane protein TolC